MSSNGLANGRSVTGVGAANMLCAPDWLGINSIGPLAGVLVRGCRFRLGLRLPTGFSYGGMMRQYSLFLALVAALALTACSMSCAICIGGGG